MVLEIYAKFYEMWQKTGYPRNPIISKPNNFFASKFDRKHSKQKTNFAKLSNLYHFKWMRNNLSKNVTAGSGRARPGRIGSGRAGLSRLLIITSKINKFCSIIRIEKSRGIGDIALFDSPMQVKCEVITKNARRKLISVLKCCITHDLSLRWNLLGRGS